MSTETLHIGKEERTVPELRFPEFKANKENNQLKRFSFEDVFTFSTGKNIKQSEASPEFEIPCVRYGELYHMYNEVIYQIVNRTNLNHNELVFSKGNEILLPSAGEDPLDIGSASALTVKNVAIGRTINILRPKLDLLYSQIYVSYYINQQLKIKIATLARGASISNVYNSDLKKLEIVLPSHNEQKKIATFLSTIDKKIQQLTRKKALLEAYKKGLMQQLFSGALRFTDEEGKDYPAWELIKLKELTEPITKGTTPKVFVKEGVSFIKIEGLNGTKINKSKCLFIDEDTHLNGLKRSILKEKDILFAIAGSVGKIGLVNSEILPANTNQAFAIIRLKNLTHLKFVLQVLNSRTMKKYIYQSKSVGAQPNLNLEQMGNFRFRLPNTEEQQKIATYLSSIDTKIETITTQITKTQTFKKGLLQQMFV